jgi:hypothetical protein
MISVSACGIIDGILYLERIGAQGRKRAKKRAACPFAFLRLCAPIRLKVFYLIYRPSETTRSYVQMVSLFYGTFFGNCSRTILILKRQTPGQSRQAAYIGRNSEKLSYKAIQPFSAIQFRGGMALLSSETSCLKLIS